MIKINYVLMIYITKRISPCIMVNIMEKNQCSVYQNGMFDYTQSNPVDLSPDVSGPLEGNIREFIFRTLFTSSSTDFTHKLDEVLRLTGHFFPVTSCGDFIL